MREGGRERERENERKRKSMYILLRCSGSLEDATYYYSMFTFLNRQFLSDRFVGFLQLFKQLGPCVCICKRYTITSIHVYCMHH